MSKAKHTPKTCGECEFAERWENDHAECSKYSSDDEIKIVARNSIYSDCQTHNWHVSPLTEPFIGIGDVIIEGTHLGRPQEMCTVHVLYSPVQESDDSAQNMPDEIATTDLVNLIKASPALLSACEKALAFINIDERGTKRVLTEIEVTSQLRAAINAANLNRGE